MTNEPMTFTAGHQRFASRASRGGMRFLLYDKITSLEKGVAVRGTKSFTLSEECFRGHYRKAALVPGVLLIEAMAQLLGWLIIYTHDFKLTTFMSLIEKVHIPARFRPGFTAEIHGRLISTSQTDSLGAAEIYLQGDCIASVERIIYSHSRSADAEELMQWFSYYSGLDKSEFQV
jgi:3-hydroxyacyl-[acyl-carrier-protein] dehydratase